MPIPSNAEIDTTQLVLELDNFDQTKKLILALNEDQWTAQKADNARFLAADSSEAEIRKVGSIEFFGSNESGKSAEEIQATITKRSRLRFGLPDLNGCGNFPTTLNWMYGCSR